MAVNSLETAGRDDSPGLEGSGPKLLRIDRAADTPVPKVGTNWRPMVRGICLAGPLFVAVVLLALVQTAPNRAASGFMGLGRMLLESIPYSPAKEPAPSHHRWTFKELERHRGKLAPYKGRKNIIWVHLHNYGGTMMCIKAHFSGEMVTRKNCNWPGDGVAGQGWRLPYAHLARCPERAAHNQISFSMIERGLGPGDLCPDALTGIMLRDPFKGARSTVLYHGYQQQVSHILQVVKAKGKMFKIGAHQGLPGKDAYMHFDNFGIRSLSGFYDAPPGQVTREHLELAKETLRRMDVIMILPEFDSHMVQLNKIFKWKLNLQRKTQKYNGHTPKQYKEAVTEENERLFKELNTLDYELYEYGKLLAANRTKAAEMGRS